MGEEVNLSQVKFSTDGVELGTIKANETIVTKKEEDKRVALFPSSEGTIKLNVKSSPVYIKFKKLYKCLKHTKKFRTKKKLFNRIYNECGFYIWTMR